MVISYYNKNQLELLNNYLTYSSKRYFSHFQHLLCNGSNDDNTGASWDEAVKTIKKAVSLTFTDDALNEIWAAKGTYLEGETIRIPQVIHLYGGFAGTETLFEERDWANNATIIDGNNAWRCVTNYGVIDGFHVTKGKTYNIFGAGIYNDKGTVENCMVYGNTLNGQAPCIGAGIYNFQGKVLNSTIYQNRIEGYYNYSWGCGIFNDSGIVDNCIVYGNESWNWNCTGGGIFNYSGLVINSTIRENDAYEGGGGIYNNNGMVHKCIVRNNSSLSGGGILNENNSTVTECNIYQNSAYNYNGEGGGIYNDSSSTVTLCQIYSNQARKGGGIYNSGVVSDCDIYENKPNGESSSGLGIFNTLGTVSNCTIHDNVIYESLINRIKGEGISNNSGTITDCRIYNNDGWGICNNYGTATHCFIYGNKKGGIYTSGIVSNSLVYGNRVCGIDNHSSGTVINCTAYGNLTEANNAGIFTKDSGTVVNSIAWKNQSGDIIGGAVRYCSYREASDENGNISGNPFFMNTLGDMSTWDFHLKNGSPCIDAGTTDTVQMPERDMEGNPRPGGDGRVCMGVYESPDEFHPWETPVPLIRFYVKSGGSDEENGLSWDTALKTIKKAADLSLSDEATYYEIWAAEGLYQEGVEISIPEYLSLYGGFSGTETERDQRNILFHQTIIDGENSHRCIRNYGIIDGFSITQGYSETGGGIHNSGFATNCRIYMNTATGTNPKGGGIYNLGEVTDCIVNSNLSQKYGGGVYNDTNGMTTSCILYDNHADSDGGGVHNKGVVTNCIFYDNHTLKNGGGIYNYFQRSATNCTLYGNFAKLGGGIYNNHTSITNNCISWKNQGGDIIGGTVQNCCYGEAKEENGNFAANPFFENVSGDMFTWDFHLREGSPCIDAGRLEGAPSNDLEGRERPGEDGTICMGAYESPDEYIPGEPSTYSQRLYVKPDGSDEETGASWDEALNTIDGAISRSFQDEFLYEIWAAKGTYMEGRTIQIPGAVHLYGGFSGTETEVEQRDWKGFSTVIDGNNSYRCVDNFGVMDGFHVTRGNCGEDGDGIYNYGSLTNCMVYGNGNIENSFDGAGIYNNYGNITHCSVYLNKTGGWGGGIYNLGGNVRHCIVYGNRAGSRAGGVYNQSGALSNCMVFDNSSVVNNAEGGGIYNYYSIINNCIVYGNRLISGYCRGGGICNYNGIIRNSIIYGNHAAQGGGIYNSYASLIANSIIWNNSPYNTYGLYDELISYSCVKGISETNGNISADPAFVNGSGDMLLWDFHLKDDSPCIDAGDPYEYYNDGCLPPGKGAERDDMGAYGGPGNCDFPEIIPPKTILGVLTEYTDFWGARNQGSPPFEEANRRGWLGFRFSPSEGWYVLKGDADQFGLDDLIQVTEYGDAWVSKSYDAMNSEPTRWGWLGFKYDEQDGYNGWLPLTGDPNGDGACDLIQVTEYGDAWVALSKGNSYASPERWGWLGYRFNRAQTGENGALPLSGDANGDGLGDLIQVTEYTDAWVALSTESVYNPPTRWGWLGFKYAPYDGWYPMCGDVNADGKEDLVQITPTGDPWVALSQGDSYTSPSRWGWINFYYNEELGYYPLLEDVNADGRKDLIQITPEGEVWVAPALDGVFDDPEYWGKPGFIFSREKKYLPFFLDN